MRYGSKQWLKCCWKTLLPTSIVGTHKKRGNRKPQLTLSGLKCQELSSLSFLADSKRTTPQEMAMTDVERGTAQKESLRLHVGVLPNFIEGAGGSHPTVAQNKTMSEGS